MNVRLKLCKTSNNINKINILSQSVPRRQALDHENIQQYLQNWYFITIRPAKASSRSWKYPTIFTKLIFYHNPSREGELSIMKISNNIHKINILSESVPRRRTLNHEKFPTILSKLIFYHNPSSEDELSIIKKIQKYYQKWYFITIRPAKRILNHKKYLTILSKYIYIINFQENITQEKQ